MKRGMRLEAIKAGWAAVRLLDDEQLFSADADRIVSVAVCAVPGGELFPHVAGKIVQYERALREGGEKRWVPLM